MRIALLAFFLLGVSSAHADTPRTDMGTWDCSGSKPRAVQIGPGDHVFVWGGHGCLGAEGWDVVIEPKDGDLKSTMTTDAKTHEIVLKVTNRGKRTIAVKLHVFVGFA